MPNPPDSTFSIRLGNLLLSGITSSGAKERNEDYYGAMILNDGKSIVYFPGEEVSEQYIQNSEKVILGMLSDGVGGLPNGDDASRFTVWNFFGEISKENLTSRNAVNIIEYSILIADQNLRKKFPGSGATAVLFCIVGEKLFLTHTGDSRVYIKTNNGLLWRTTDHSIQDELFKKGKITEESAMSSPMRDKIYSCLGMKCEPTTDVIDMQWETVLISSDGYHSPFTDDTVRADINKPLPDLLKKSLDAGSTDNITILRAQKVSD
jgi:protein phosphatase